MRFYSIGRVGHAVGRSRVTERQQSNMGKFKHNEMILQRLEHLASTEHANVGRHCQSLVELTVHAENRREMWLHEATRHALWHGSCEGVGGHFTRTHALRAFSGCSAHAT